MTARKTQMIAVAVLGLLLAAGLAWRALRGPAARSDRPNVLIVLWDTVRADRMSLYGYDRPTTPKMAARAQDALVFEQAWAAGVWTVPSHASLFTGLPVRTHGANIRYRWLDDHHVTMAEWYRQHGYATYAFSANPNLTPGHLNLLQGFDTVDLSWRRPWAGPTRKHTERKLIAEDASSELSPAWPGKRPKARSDRFFNAGPVARKAFVRWVEDQQQPWLAYLSYMEAHKPRVPSRKARNQVASADLVARSMRVDQGMVRQLGAMAGGPGYSQAELEALDATYDATLVDLDDATAALLDDLQGRGLLDNTVVVLTSDHGENLGEHGHFLHKTGLWQPISHVPLVIWGPGVAAGRVPTAVSNQQVFATLNRLTGLPQPASGLDSRDLINGAPAPVHAELTATAPQVFKAIRDVPGTDIRPLLRKIQAVTHQGRKLIRYEDGERFVYDLGSDPAEERNLADGGDPLDAVLDRFVADTPAYDAGKRGKTDGPRKSGKERQQMLEALGYVEP